MSLEDTGVAPEAAPATTPPPAADTKPAAESAPPVEYRNEAEADEALTATLREKYRELTAPEASEPPSRERDEAGRFVGKEPKPAEAPKEAPAAKIDEKPSKTPAEKPVEAPKAETPKPAADAPRSWAADMKAKWAAVPDDVKPYVAARETELHEAKSQIGRLEAIAKPLQSVLAANEKYLREVGAHNKPIEYIDHVLKGAEMLDRNPAAAIKHFAKVYGVDLGQLWDPAEQDPDPQVAALQRQVVQYERQLQSIQEERAAQEKQSQAARDQEMLQFVEKFMASKPDVFRTEAENERIWSEVSPFVAAIRARNPQLGADAVLNEAWTAYERTLPASFEKLVAAEADKKLKERDAAAAEAAAKARAANSVNVRSAPNARDADNDDDEEQRLRAVYRRSRAQ